MRKGSNKGFTLIEVMVASAISVVVLGNIIVLLISSQKLLNSIMGNIELTLKAQELSNKIMFHMFPDHSGLVGAANAECHNDLGSVTFYSSATSTNKRTIMPTVSGFTLTGASGYGREWFQLGSFELANLTPFTHPVINNREDERYISTNLTLEASPNGRSQTIQYTFMLPIFGAKSSDKPFDETFDIYRK